MEIFGYNIEKIGVKATPTEEQFDPSVNQFGFTPANGVAIIRQYDLWNTGRGNFSNVVWIGLMNKLTSISNDVRILGSGLESAFIQNFIDRNGQEILNHLFNYGYAAIEKTKTNNYRYVAPYNFEDIEVLNNGASFFIKAKGIKSENIIYSNTFREYGNSDKVMAKSYLDLIDSILQASQAVNQRLGQLMVISPQQPNNMPATTVLTEKQRKDLEKNISENYGSGTNQSSVLILNRPVNIETVSFAQMDNKIKDRLIVPVAILADFLDIPSQYSALINTDAKNLFSSAGSISENQVLLYKRFDRAFMPVYNYFRLDYKIENDPREQIETKIDNLFQ